MHFRIHLDRMKIAMWLFHNPYNQIIDSKAHKRFSRFVTQLSAFSVFFYLFLRSECRLSVWLKLFASEHFSWEFSGKFEDFKESRIRHQMCKWTKHCSRCTDRMNNWIQWTSTEMLMKSLNEKRAVHVSRWEEECRGKMWCYYVRLCHAKQSYARCWVTPWSLFWTYTLQQTNPVSRWVSSIPTNSSENKQFGPVQTLLY